MNILIVDDERLPLENLRRTVEGVLPDAKVTGFMKPSEVLKFAQSTQESKVDLAFLDIEMGGMNGLQLAKRLKDIYGKVNIVFTTGYSKYALDAYSLHASGFLMKPISADAVIEAVDHLRYPVISVDENSAHSSLNKSNSLNTNFTQCIRVQTFGSFEIFANGKPLNLSRTKTKELFAYLIMRKGAYCTNNEIIAVLWEDRPNTSSLQNQYRHLVLDLTKSLKSVGAEDILMKKRGALAVLPDRISCDLYDFLAVNTQAVNNYTGEFMAQYSWAEFTNAYLDKMAKSTS